MKANIPELKANTNIVDVIGSRVSLRKKGAEHVGTCPFHDDHRASLQVNERKQIFSCFACGKSGDVIDFLVESGATFAEAIAELEGGTKVAHTTAKVTRDRTKHVTWRQVTPAPTPGQIAHYKHGAPSRSWEYRSASGELLGLICRFDTADGKEVIPYTFCTDGTRNEWRWQGFEAPRPLYGLDRLAANSTATVLVVEGEKTADAAQALLPHIVVVAWQGGARAIGKTDWAPLHGKRVVFWPDNDRPGDLAMHDIADLLRPHCPTLKWVRNAPEFPEKWDVADAEWTPEQALAYVRANMVAVPERPADEPEPQPALEPQPEPANELPPPSDEPPLNMWQDFDTSGYIPPPDDFGHDQPQVVDEGHFEVLGFVKENEKPAYVIFVRATKQIYILSPNSLSGQTMLAIAPLEWWQTAFPKKRGRGSWDGEMAASWIMGIAHERGIFSPKRIRGRGAWMDDGRVVVHCGDHLLVDGRRVEIGDLKSRYYYQAAEPLAFANDKPLDTTNAHKLMTICELLNWERPVNAHLLAGYCVIAPICGALTWRPHIWLTGAAGTGKSWVFKNIVRKLLGEFAVAVQSETSEAGLRQELAGDALPVVFDEAEGETPQARARMESVIALARASSADDGGGLVKGSASGGAKRYLIRSCFSYASIGVQATHRSDLGRITVLGISKPDEKVRAERWAKLQTMYKEVVTDTFVQKLQARTISLLPVILENAKTFADAAADELGEQRAGDQLGALLAGAYSLHRTDKISYAKAREWVRGKDWSEERQADGNRDELALFQRIVEHIVRVDGSQGLLERTIGELCLIASGYTMDSLVTGQYAESKLARLGIRADAQYVTVSNSGVEILRILKDTPWQKNHGKTLARIEGAVQATSVRFGPGAPTRAVRVPISILM